MRSEAKNNAIFLQNVTLHFIPTRIWDEMFNLTRPHIHMGNLIWTFGNLQTQKQKQKSALVLLAICLLVDFIERQFLQKIKICGFKSLSNLEKGKTLDGVTICKVSD